MDETPTHDAPSKPPRRYWRTRIAVSVFFGVVTVALCVLWVLSYHHQVFVSYPLTNQNAFTVLSGDGNVQVAVSTRQYREFKFESAELDSQSIEEDKRLLNMEANRLVIRRDRTWVSAPYWLYAVSIAAFTAIPWPYWRFSLRTLLIATTLVAVVLGLGVWLAR